MQGKYKLSIMRNVGHIMHEDKSDKTMKFIKDFIRTFRITVKERWNRLLENWEMKNQKVMLPLKYDKLNANKKGEWNMLIYYLVLNRILMLF